MRLPCGTVTAAHLCRWKLHLSTLTAQVAEVQGRPRHLCSHLITSNLTTPGTIRGPHGNGLSKLIQPS